MNGFFKDYLPFVSNMDDNETITILKFSMNV